MSPEDKNTTVAPERPKEIVIAPRRGPVSTTGEVEVIAGSGRRGAASRVYQVLIAVLMAALLAGYLYLTQRTTRSQANADADRQRVVAEATRAREDLVKSHQAAMTARTRELLLVAALPLAWAVRAELLQKDYREVGVYFRQLVQQSTVDRAVLILPDGLVKVASDQKLEGRPAAEALPGVAIDKDEPRVEQRGRQFLAVVPVMGLTSRLGVIVLGYDL
jgi:hypothetical protein